MKIEDINRKPFSIHKPDSDVRVIGQAGQEKTFVWYWTGDRTIVAIEGGRFVSDGTDDSGRFLDKAGNVVGYVATVADTPEFADPNEAVGEWHTLREQVTEDYHEDFMREQLVMALNSFQVEM